MKILTIFVLLLVSYLLPTAILAQQPAPASVITAVKPARVTFMLKNTLGYNRMFRAEGPGMAYGFSMGRRETVPCNWPVGSKLYFSRDGETNGALILTVTAADEGRMLTTDAGAEEPETREVARVRPDHELVRFSLRNPGLLPRRIALISYAPGESGNGTQIFMLAPLVGVKSFRFPVGTRLYLADSQQVDVVMSGKRIDSGKPFMTVAKDDAGKSIPVQ